MIYMALLNMTKECQDWFFNFSLENTPKLWPAFKTAFRTQYTSGESKLEEFNTPTIRKSKKFVFT